MLAVETAMSGTSNDIVDKEGTRITNDVITGTKVTSREEKQLSYKNATTTTGTTSSTVSSSTYSASDSPETEQDTRTQSMEVQQGPKLNMERERMNIDDDTSSHIIKEAMELYHDDRLLEAARLLRKQSNSGEITNVENKILHLESKIEKLISVLGHCEKEDENKEWIQVGGDVKKNDDTPSISYKLSNDHSNLQIKVQQTIEPELLVPLLSVLNETQLYQTWLPSFRGPPKFGIRRVMKLAQTGRCGQIILATFDLPWPLSPREIVLRAIAVDDISSEGDIIVHIQSLRENDEDDGNIVPPIDDPAICRMDFDGGFLFRKHHQSDDNGQKKMAVQFYVNLHSGAFGKVPGWVVKFFVSQVFWRSWNMFIKVALDVQNGKRPAHAKAIEEKRKVLYNWVDERIKQMMSLQYDE